MSSKTTPKKVPVKVVDKVPQPDTIKSKKVPSKSKVMKSESKPLDKGLLTMILLQGLVFIGVLYLIFK